jgi:hypothetical protein
MSMTAVKRFSNSDSNYFMKIVQAFESLLQGMSIGTRRSCKIKKKYLWVVPDKIVAERDIICTPTTPISLVKDLVDIKYGSQCTDSPCLV